MAKGSKSQRGQADAEQLLAQGQGREPVDGGGKVGDETDSRGLDRFDGEDANAANFNLTAN